jgi:thiosulfate reductase cytochrome b subunit
VQVYSAFERLWHWLQAAAILGLIVTGIEIHAPGTVPGMGFQHAARAHEVLALVTVANAFLSLFYHLATGAIGQFIPEPRDFFSLALAQTRYYARGIFTGAAHPLKRPGYRLNVLQQVTYLAILNLALPIQVVTGILMWKATSWPGLIEALGGLRWVAGLHTLAAWLFVAFVIAHVYLTTTGRTPLAHLRAMIVGWEPEDRTDRTEAPHGP